MVPIVVLCIGLLVIFLEFFLPGGILALIGAVVIIASIVLYAIQDNSPLGIALFVIGAIIGVIATCKAALTLLRRSTPKAGWYSHADQEGYKATEFNSETIGKRGKAYSDLKPSGYVIVEGKRYQALSQSGYIEEGTDIQVIGGQGAYLLVKIQ